ncbi:MAG TPA: hypothetical protein ENJ85_05155 [Oceanithermus profundus]|uniref:MmcB family DNA repair protein n=1 Tax=Oceanithermus profundus TaxID=187137 RepID=A0A7C5SQ74_9DEIN|nr:hypothetical protein [Oceanithermus profundus]
MTDRVPAAAVERALEKRYPSDKWWIATEVSFGRRRCDFVAVKKFGDMERVGVEVKVARSDWLRELNDPGKAADALKVLDEWYVAAPPGVVEVAELPAQWGLLQLTRAGNLRIKKRSDVPPKGDLSRPVAAALIRRIVRAEVRAAARAQDESAKRAHEEYHQIFREVYGLRIACKDAERARDLYKGRVQKLEECLRALGVDPAKLQGYTSDPIAPARDVLAAATLGGKALRHKLEAALAELHGVLGALERVRDECFDDVRKAGEDALVLEEAPPGRVGA